jgi:hypothetical protein
MYNTEYEKKGGKRKGELKPRRGLGDRGGKERKVKQMEDEW